MLGARTGVWSKDGGGVPTAKDYVQDGLIAMWDGIENAGWGVHDPNATVWKDLVGGYDIPLNEGCYTWKDDQIESTLVTPGQYAGIVDIPRLGYAKGSFHVESINVPVDVKKVNAASSFKGIEASDEFWNTGTACEYISYEDYYGFLTNVGSQYQSNWGRSKRFSAPITVTCVDSLNFKNPGSEPNTFGRNGSMITPHLIGYVGQTWIPNPKGRMRVLKSTYSIYALKCLRVYDRDLSPDEIAANYAIDKARFDLHKTT